VFLFQKRNNDKSPDALKFMGTKTENHIYVIVCPK